jgi:hypothetical protein
VYQGYYPMAQPVLLLSQQVLPALADVTTVCCVLGITEDLEQVHLGHRYEALHVASATISAAASHCYDY